MAVQLDHGATAHPQQLVHRDDRAAQNHRDFDFDVIDIGSHGATPYICGDPARVPQHGFGKLNLDAPAAVLKAENRANRPPVEWKISDRPVSYPDALAAMDARAAAIAGGTAGEQVWLLEHPPIYTAGTSAKDSDLIEARFPVYRTGRGGQFTYHGPGQRVGYAMLDLKTRTPDVRAYVRDLEQW